ncbi:hypothetical protein Pelo_4770 [Pelomyxa schiedti]|nr:hypothetical protein Pelo_4770 [Pelomyxa schiedti]
MRRSDVIAVCFTGVITAAIFSAVLYASYTQFKTYDELYDVGVASFLLKTSKSALMVSHLLSRHQKPAELMALSFSKSLQTPRTPPAEELASYEWRTNSYWNWTTYVTFPSYGGSAAHWLTTDPLSEEQIEYFFWRTGSTDDLAAQMMQLWPNIVNVYTCLAVGFIRCYPWYDIVAYNVPPFWRVEDQIYYYPAMPENNPGGGQVWCEPYLDILSNAWMVSLLTQVRSVSNGDFLGVTGIDILITRSGGPLQVTTRGEMPPALKGCRPADSLLIAKSTGSLRNRHEYPTTATRSSVTSSDDAGDGRATGFVFLTRSQRSGRSRCCGCSCEGTFGVSVVLLLKYPPIS